MLDRYHVRLSEFGLTRGFSRGRLMIPSAGVGCKPNLDRLGFPVIQEPRPNSVSTRRLEILWLFRNGQCYRSWYNFLTSN